MKKLLMKLQTRPIFKQHFMESQKSHKSVISKKLKDLKVSLRNGRVQLNMRLKTLVNPQYQDRKRKIWKRAKVALVMRMKLQIQCSFWLTSREL